MNQHELVQHGLRRLARLTTLGCVRPLMTLGALVLAACGVAPPGEVGGAGGGRALPVVAQVTVPTGSTNVDPLAGVQFTVERTADNAEISRLITQVAEGAGFFDDQSTRLCGAVASGGFVLRPTCSLSADTWYELRLGAASGYLLGSVFHHDPATGVVRFFTGSAPRLRHLSRTALSKPGDKFVTVAFTEPVTLGTASGDAMKLYDGSTAFAGCAWGENVCLDAGATLRTTVVDYRFEQQSEGPPPVTRIAIAGTATGGGRTFAQGAALHGDALGGDGRVSYEVSSWVSCGQDIECWRPPAR